MIVNVVKICENCPNAKRQEIGSGGLFSCENFGGKTVEEVAKNCHIYNRLSGNFVMTLTSVVDIHKKRGKRPEYDIYIGRAVRGTEFTRPSKYHNPFRVGDFWGGKLITREGCLTLFAIFISEKIRMFPATYDLRELVGKRLGDWCVTTSEITPLVCHGQILIKLIREAGLE